MTKPHTPGVFVDALRGASVEPRQGPRKLRVNLEVDADILAYFPGTGAERKAAIHQVLRNFVDDVKD